MNLMSTDELIRIITEGTNWSGVWTTLWTSPKQRYAIIKKSSGSCSTGNRRTAYSGTQIRLVALFGIRVVPGYTGSLILNGSTVDGFVRKGRVSKSLIESWKNFAEFVEDGV